MSQRFRVAGEQAAGAVGQEQSLVRVERDGVGALDAGQRGPAALGELEEPAVRGIDVEPQALIAGQVRDRR